MTTTTLSLRTLRHALWAGAIPFYKATGVQPFAVAGKTLPASVLADLAKAKAAKASEEAAKK